jgi:hypothetical protein
MLTNVGRRSLESEENAGLVNLGLSSLNGYENNCLFENDGGGHFDEVAYHRGCDLLQDGRGVVVWDYDQDGDQDLYISNYRRRGSLLRNDLKDGNWLQVKLTGTRSNRDGVGARVTLHSVAGQQHREVRIGGSHLSAQSLIQHFGIGHLDRVEKLTIRWPSGVRQVLEDLPINERLHVVEPED